MATIQDVLEMERDGKLTDDQLRKLDEQRQLGNITQQPLPKNESTSQQTGDFIQKVGDVGSLGFGNQIGAGVAAGADYIANLAKLHPESLDALKQDYEQNRDWGMRQERDYTQQHPVASTVASVAGGVLPMIAEGPVGTALEAKSASTPFLGAAMPSINAAGTGALEGAAYGEGENVKNEDLTGLPNNNSGDVTDDALIGAAGGLGGQLLGHLLASPVQKGVNWARNQLAKTPLFEDVIPPAEQQSLSAGYLASKFGGDADKILERLNNTPEDVPDRLIYALGNKGMRNLRMMRAKYPDLSPIIDSALGADAQETTARLGQHINNHLGDYGSQDMDQLQDIMKEKRRNVTEDLYKEALHDQSFVPQNRLIADLLDPEYEGYKTQGRTIQNADTKEQLKQSGSLDLDPRLQDPLQKNPWVNDPYRTNPKPLADRLNLPTSTDDPFLRDISMQDLINPNIQFPAKEDVAKNVFNKAMDTSKVDTGVNPYMRDLHGILQGLYEDAEQQETAKNLAKAASLKKQRYNISEALKEQSPTFANAQQEYAKYSNAIDLLKEKNNLLLSHPETVKQLLSNPTMQDAARAKAASDIHKMMGTKGTMGSILNNPQFNSGYARENLMQIAKDPETLIKKLDAEKNVQDTIKQIMGGSQTADKLGEQNALLGSVGQVASAVRHPINTSLDLLTRMSLPSEAATGEAAQKMLSTNPSEFQKTLEDAQKQYSKKRALSNVIAQVAKNQLAQSN